MALIDDLLIEFKKVLDIQDDEIDELLKEILIISESYIYDYYNVGIFERDLVERINKIYGNSIYTKKGLISEIIKITIDGEELENDVLLSFEIGELNRIYLPVLFSIENYQIMRIEYKVGYNDIDLIPEGLVSGLLLLGKKLYNDVTKDTDNIASLSTGIRESMKVNDEVPAVVDKMLNSFRVFRL